MFNPDTVPKTDNDEPQITEKTVEVVEVLQSILQSDSAPKNNANDAPFPLNIDHLTSTKIGPESQQKPVSLWVRNSVFA